jgi:hypothetical protein
VSTAHQFDEAVGSAHPTFLPGHAGLDSCQ